MIRAREAAEGGVCRREILSIDGYMRCCSTLLVCLTMRAYDEV